MSAEKWVSRTRVSAGEYHIATLRRGLRRALHVAGWCVWVRIYSYTRSYTLAGCVKGGVTSRPNRVSAR